MPASTVKAAFPFSLLFFLGFSVLSIAQGTGLQPDPVIEVLRQRLMTDALAKKGFTSSTERYMRSDFDKASVYLRNLNESGGWEDIDYADQDNAWNPLVALDRMLVMSYAYARENGDLYQNQALLAGIVKALDYWYKVNPRCKNWYKNDIAKQFYFNVMGIILQASIDDELLAKITEDLTAAPRMTGSNKTLLSISVFYRGVIEGNMERVKAAIKGVKDQIQKGANEGIQIDNSFHQHGPFLYNGNYGHNFLRETMWFAAILQGTPYAYTEAEMEIMRDYYLEGTRWMLRGGLIDYNVRGRQVGRTASGFGLGGAEIVPQLDHFIAADPAYQETYRTSQQRILNKVPQAIAGNRHFWHSDYMIHHRQDYTISLKMCSKRTIGMEMDVNTENLYGYYLPFGLSYLYRTGEEYLNIFPVWDWARLPGVTSPHQEIKVKGKSTQETVFVGGVSDGRYGLTTMDLDIQQTQAKKSWFWFDREWVALGTGIQSSHDAPIVTGVNQSLLKGEVVLNGKVFDRGQQTFSQASWVWHDSIAYIFPTDQKVVIKAEEQSGQLQKIFGLGVDSIYRSDVFSLWFDHGAQPKMANYAYTVLPGIGATDMAQYKTPIQVISNTQALQAVHHHALQLTGIVFHEAGECSLPGGGFIRVDQACLILINQKTKEISISDPTATIRQINTLMQLNAGDIRRDAISLPAGPWAGQTMTIDWE